MRVGLRLLKNWYRRRRGVAMAFSGGQGMYEILLLDCLG